MNKPLQKEGKSQVIENILESFSKQLGNPRSVAFKTSTCVTCGKDATAFRDSTSEKEYALSGMCQDCQDEIWG
jgi:hypothetical protein